MLVEEGMEGKLSEDGSLKEKLKKENLEMKDEIPKDRYRIVYGGFCLLGVGNLFPWSVFVMANGYFTVRFLGSSFVDNFENYFSIVYMIAYMVTLLGTLKFQQRWNVDYRVLIPFILIFVIFLLSTIFVKVEGLQGNAFFYCNLVFVLLCGSTSAIVQPSVIGFASQLPTIYVQSTMTGQAVAGVAISLASFFTSFGDDTTSPNKFTNILIYFILAMVVILICIACFIYLRRHPYVVYGISQRQEEEEEEEQKLASTDTILYDDTKSVIHADDKPSVLYVFKKIWDLFLGAFLVYFITLSAYPAIFSKVISVNSELSFFNQKLFIPFGFLLFSLNDFLGRVLTGFQFFNSIPLIWHHILSFLRILFLPLCMICNIQLIGKQVYTPHLIRNDGVFFLLYSLFGLSNGFLGTLYMMRAPNRVKSNHKELVGMIMVLALIGGLTLGSFFSFFLRWIICRCNPFA
jgi:equilibrative nucleoside transporter 1/2/3